MAITLFGVASNPADNGTNSTSANVVAPPASMQQGDLVFVICNLGRTTGTWSVSQAGGQVWTTGTARNASGARTRTFYCVFNGTWDANPSFASSNGYTNTCLMLVYRGNYGTTGSWKVDKAESSATFTAPGSPYTVTTTSITTVLNDALVIAWWTCAAANTWGTLTGSTHTFTALATPQYRNTNATANPISISAAWMIDAAAGATGTASQNESAGTVGTRGMISFSEFDSPAPSCADTVTVAENVSVCLEALVTGSDAVTVSEARSLLVGDVICSRSDLVHTDDIPTLNVSDLVGKLSVSDAVTVGNVPTVAYDDSTISRSDAVTISEARTVALDALAVGVSDAVTVAEAVIVEVEAAPVTDLNIGYSASALFGQLNVPNDTHYAPGDVLRLSRFQNIAGSGTLTDLEVFEDAEGHDYVIWLGIYEDNAGVPGDLLVDVGETTLSCGNWVKVSGLSSPVVNNDYYWLGFIQAEGNRTPSLYYPASPDTHYTYEVAQAYGAFPSACPEGGSYDLHNNYGGSQFSLRATVATVVSTVLEPISVSESVSVQIESIPEIDINVSDVVSISEYVNVQIGFIVYIQGTVGALEAENSVVSLQHGANTTNGNCVIICVFWKADVTIVSVGDDQENVYEDCGAGRIARPISGYLQVLGAKNIIGGAIPSVTVTFSGTATEVDIYLLEYSGADSETLFDSVHGDGTAVSGTELTTGNFTPTISGGAIIAFACGDSASTPLAGANFRKRMDRLGSYVLIEDRIFDTSLGETNAVANMVGAIGKGGIIAAVIKAENILNVSVSDSISVTEYIKLSPPSVITILASTDNWDFWYDEEWKESNSSATYGGFGRYATKDAPNFIRFTLPVAIPAGSTITAAQAWFFGFDSCARSCYKAWAYVSDSADAPAITGAEKRPSWVEAGETDTYPNSDQGAGAVVWPEGGGTSDWNVNGPNIFTDLKDLIQYLVDTYGGLAEGANIGIWLIGDNAELSFNEFIGSTWINYPDHPRLYIDFTGAADLDIHVEENGVKYVQIV